MSLFFRASISLDFFGQREAQKLITNCQNLQRIQKRKDQKAQNTPKIKKLPTDIKEQEGELDLDYPMH